MFVKQTWNEDGTLNHNLLFKYVDDCSICPFSSYNEGEFMTLHICNGSPDGFHPCERMDDYGEMTLDEVVDEVNEGFHKAEAYWEGQWLAKKEKEERQRSITEKANRTRMANYELNYKIKQLRKRIKHMETYIQTVVANKVSWSQVNAMFNYGKVISEKDVLENDLDIKNLKHKLEEDRKTLCSLIKERDKVNRERRRRNG